MITAMLHHWSWPQLLNGAQLLVLIQAHQTELRSHCIMDWEEARFALTTMIEWEPQSECCLQECLAGTVVRAQEDGESEELVTLLRACFLISLAYDERVRCFVMAQHDVHRRLHTHPPQPVKLEAYMLSLRPLVDVALARQISLHMLCEMAIAEWSSRFMY
jgi:hypothetical protein